MLTRLVTLTFTEEEAEAVWAWLNQYYPDSREAWGSAIEKLGEAMKRAGVPVVFADGTVFGAGDDGR